MATCYGGNSVMWTKFGSSADLLDEAMDAIESDPRIVRNITMGSFAVGSYCTNCGIELDGNPMVFDGKPYCGACGRNKEA